ncbi:hypothetical protein [Microvirga massiliensis]|uniref:hypothetical protein n=1 Tax=Microvirga massiliensis TaxID=1033741 RepID=UPI00062B9C78|nr:hypothetical protein [Microvirga massiliensis]
MLKPISLACLALGLGACMPAAPPHYLSAPADSSIPGRPLAYAPVMAGVRNYDAVEPKDWRELNRSVGPQTAPERGDSDDAARRGR